jgi:hypothetical protein
LNIAFRNTLDQGLCVEANSGRVEKKIARTQLNRLVATDCVENKNTGKEIQIVFALIRHLLSAHS